MDYEREATQIRWYEPLLVPGLLQTEEYARILLEDGSPDQAESLLGARMERQLVLERAQVMTIVDELVLRRQIGTPEVMHRQLAHLTEVRAVVQVLPTGAATYRHLLGPFALGAVDGSEVAYVDTPARGFRAGQPGGGSIAIEAALGVHPSRGAAAATVPRADLGSGGVMEQQLTWRKSSRSGGNGGGCVEVASRPDRVLVRDSKDKTGPVLTVNPTEWSTFLRSLPA